MFRSVEARFTSLALGLVVALSGGLLAGCSGDEGPAGATGEVGASCTVTQAADGTSTITCDDGSTAVIPPAEPGTPGEPGEPGGIGANGTSCTVVENPADGTRTISCTDGSSVTVPAGTPGDPGEPGAPGTSCTVTDTAPGVKTITCTDGTTATITDGTAGTDGNSCSAVENADGTKTITCTDGTSVTVSNGLPGSSTVNLAAEVPEAFRVTIDNVSVGPVSTVNFTVLDAAGRGAVGLKAGSTGNVRMGMAKLLPASGGNDGSWLSYIDRSSTNGATTTAQGTNERTGTLVDNLDGSYTYTFFNDLTAATDAATGAAVPFEPNLTHRVTLQISGSINGQALPYNNTVSDFVPAGGAVSDTHKVVMTESCNECHGELRIHGSRIEVDYCVTCHNPGTTDPDPLAAANVNTGATADFAPMIHAIHATRKRTADGAADYYLAGEPWNETTYPQPLENCRKCHDAADTATPDAGNWQNFPTKQACGACHAAVNLTTGTGHTGGAQATNNNCDICHSAADIEGYHQNENDTPNNPGSPSPLSDFTYELGTITVNASNQAVVDFRILRDGVAIDPAVLPADLTGGPSFVVAYAAAQDGVDAPGYWNNLGKAAGQPASVSVANLRNGTQGTLAPSATAGFTTATLTSAASLYPAGATMRAVSLQGYFSQTADTGDGRGSVSHARHTVSVIATATGDAVRERLVDSAKCANCHEWFEGHGGNRVYEIQLCAVCHNPNLTSSGRTVDIAQIGATTAAQLQAAGYSTAVATDPLAYSEVSGNLKDMIHSIHGAGVRSTIYEFIRNRGASGVYYYDFSEVAFPGILNNCQTCHVPGSYGVEMADNRLPTSVRVTSGVEAAIADVTAVRATVPNATDIVNTPVAAACFACHDTENAAAHMEQNGGLLGVVRSSLGNEVETCAVCHGAGKLADVELVHDL